MASLPLFVFDRVAELSLPDTLKVVALVSKALHSVVLQERRRWEALLAAAERPGRGIEEKTSTSGYYGAKYRTTIAVEDPSKFPDLGPQAAKLFRRLEIHLSASFLNMAPSMERGVIIPGMTMEESIQPVRVEWGIRVPRRRKDGRPAEFLTVQWLYRRVFDTVGHHSLGATLGAGETQDSRYNVVAFNVHQDSGNAGVSGVTVIFIFDQHSGELCDSYWNLEVGASEVRVAAQTDDLPERMVSSIPSVFAHLYIFKPGCSPVHASNGAIALAGEMAATDVLATTTATRREVPGGVFMPSSTQNQAEDLEPMENLTRFDIVNANHCPWTLVDLVEIITASSAIATQPATTTLLPNPGATESSHPTISVAISAGSYSGSNGGTETLDVIDRQFFEPFTKMVSGVNIPIFRVKEEEADLTTPKGTWRCKTGMATLRQVEMKELWTKKVLHYKQLFLRKWRKDLVQLLHVVPLGELLSQVSSFDWTTLQERAAVNLASGLVQLPSGECKKATAMSSTRGGRGGSPQTVSGISFSGLSAFQLALPGGGSISGDSMSRSSMSGVTGGGTGGETETMAILGTPQSKSIMGSPFSSPNPK